MSEEQIYALGQPAGFRRSTRRGFIGMSRTPKGFGTAAQRLDVFTWSCPRRLAAEAGIPAAYLVFDFQGTRLRLPLVDWPSPEHKRRPWAEVAAEFHHRVGPALEVSEHETAVEKFIEIARHPRFRL